MSMSRLQSVVLTIAALMIAGYSFVPPWVDIVPMMGFQGRSVSEDAPELALPHPLSSWPLWNPPAPKLHSGVRIDYARLALYYLGTIVLVIPFFVWRRHATPAAAE